MNTLEAINTILSAIGQRPVADLTPPVSPMVSAAQEVLTRVDRDVQSRGWYFNLARDVVLTPDGGNLIAISVDMLHVKNYDFHATDKLFVIRNAQLYDTINQTNQFLAPVTMDITYLVDFEDIPYHPQSYIVARASRLFHDRYAHDAVRQRSLSGDEASAWTELQAIEAEATNANMYDAPLPAAIRRWRGRRVL